MCSISISHPFPQSITESRIHSLTYVALTTRDPLCLGAFVDIVRLLGESERKEPYRNHQHRTRERQVGKIASDSRINMHSAS